MARTVKRFFKVVASKAKASRGSSAGQRLSTQRSKGAKQVLTSRSQRWSPRLAEAS
jgi:hypothetical protein